MRKRLFSALWRTPTFQKTFLFTLVTEDDWVPDDDNEDLAGLLISGGPCGYFRPTVDDLIIAPVDVNSLPSGVEDQCREWLPEIHCPHNGRMHLVVNA